ncbi:TetR/AcrR family transcriptional regulator [Thalassovita sp.]|uniref:TetR/AcrR family transcriptional regulator n=1 Tax=Thalassovita sp. TaxID=1979401 RepID=UPI0029DE59CB|nr:TetR/AcrR family transcriptional regulator [Thalassovita sp.]
MSRKQKPQAPQPRAVSSERRKARTRKRLIEAGVLVLAERGPEATLIDHVISQAEVSRGTFYNYFTSIEDLAQSARQELAEEITALLESATAPQSDPAVRLAVKLRVYLDISTRYPLFLEFMARLGLRAMGPGNAIHGSLMSLVQEAQDSGDFCIMPRLLAAELLQASTLAILRQLHEAEPADLPEFVAAMLRMLGVDRSQAEHIASQPVPHPQLPADSLIVRSEIARVTRKPRMVVIG